MKMPDTTTARQPVKTRLVYSSVFFALMLLLAAPAILAQESDNGEFDDGQFDEEFDGGGLDDGGFDDGQQQQQPQQQPQQQQQDTPKGTVQGGPQGPDNIQQTPRTGGPALLPLAAMIATAGLAVSYWKRR